MAIQAVGANALTSAPAQTAGRGTAAGVAKSGGASAGAAAKSGGGSDSTTVISQTTKVNADGSVTTTITYADGHVDSQTTPPSLAAALYPTAVAAGKSTPAAARGNNLDVTA
jgi:hypothetical protein